MHCCRSILLVLAGLAALPEGPAGAAVSDQAAAALGSRLTPLGAERAGNEAGTIPPWTGGDTTAPPGYVEGDPRPDPFAGERPLYAIGPADLAAHAGQLPEGQQALLRKFPDYRLEVYPTHRTAAAPESVYAATRANATRAQAGPAGITHGIVGAAGGIPFPIPRDGAEAVWNHLLAYWGAARSDRLSTWFTAADGTLELTHRYRETVDFPYYYPAASPGGFGAYYLRRREISEAPPALAGRGYVLWQPLDSSADAVEAWQYLPGQHRVRKSPSLAYDTPTPDGGGILSFDDYYLFSGSPDRYDYRLIGKQEMIVPYNNNRFALLPVAAVAGPHHVVPEALRWELHRVWVVDATLAAGQRHLAPHRRLYLDEDTWFALYCDAWDADGRLWKFSHGTMFDLPDLPAVVLGSTVTYDLQNGGWVLAFAFNGEAGQYRLTAPHPASEFAPESLAAEGVR
jgi:hypothetical protein